MKLSIIIVNYNVKHFLEQCLHSVKKAIKDLQAEIFVVDNNSVDGSVSLIREKFPEVELIVNKDNVGFSRANNQAIRSAGGEYILLLNPDTIVEEDTFSKIIRFMDSNQDAGGLGVKMIDGKGNYLPESKRGLPTPWVAFYKIFGISRLFPRSKTFGRYHLSFLDENEMHQVDVLAGAFMLLRKKVLDKTGLLDETFFMYGEDIDLSYRITKAGYKNYYFPETTIIHYKGESTKKGSLNYIRLFYNAMIIFARKHFSGGNAGFFSMMIHLAIYFRAILSVLKRIAGKIYLPLMDALIIYAGFLIITPAWEVVRYENGYYPPEFMNVVVPAYIVLWLLGIWFSGGYKKPVNVYKLARGIVWGSVAILLAYSLADEQHRFSRALILMGSLLSVTALVVSRWIFHILRLQGFRLDTKKSKRIAIAGHSKEALRVKTILEKTRIQSELSGFIALDQSDKGDHYIGNMDQLKEIIRINRIDELIFCAENIPSAKIISAMLELSQLNIDYKIAPPESISIIGSNSIHTAGDLYVLQVNAISKISNKKIKRLFDVACAVIFTLFLPAVIWFYRNKKGFLDNLVRVMKGEKSWIGYIGESGVTENLPELKEGILNPGILFKELQLDKEKKRQLNLLYAKDYSISTDFEILTKGWKQLDK